MLAKAPKNIAAGKYFSAFLIHFALADFGKLPRNLLNLLASFSDSAGVSSQCWPSFMEGSMKRNSKPSRKNGTKSSLLPFCLSSSLSKSELKSIRAERLADDCADAPALAARPSPLSSALDPPLSLRFLLPLPLGLPLPLRSRRSPSVLPLSDRSAG